MATGHRERPGPSGGAPEPATIGLGGLGLRGLSWAKYSVNLKWKFCNFGDSPIGPNKTSPIILSPKVLESAFIILNLLMGGGVRLSPFLKGKFVTRSVLPHPRSHGVDPREGPSSGFARAMLMVTVSSYRARVAKLTLCETTAKAFSPRLDGERQQRKNTFSVSIPGKVI